MKIAYNVAKKNHPAPYKGVILDLTHNGEYCVLVAYWDDLSLRLSERKAQEFVAWMFTIAQEMTDVGHPTVIHLEDTPPAVP